MPGPQLEDGYTKIANEILEALARIRIPGEARQVLDAILRKTYGWGKKEDKISLPQLKKMTGIPKPNIVRARNVLEEMNIIIVIKTDNGKTVIYRIQKDYMKWKPLSKPITLSKKITTVIETDKKSLSETIPTKETIKETIKRKMSPTEFDDLDKALCNRLYDKIIENNPKARIRNITDIAKEKWLTECKRLREIDKRTQQEIEEVIDWSQKDDFEKSNILSMPKMRKRFDHLWLKMNRDKKRDPGYEKRMKDWEGGGDV